MSLELFDLEWYIEGGVFVFALIALGLMVASTVFVFLLWRKGEEDLLFKFIGYILASVALVGGTIAAAQLLGGEEETFLVGSFIFIFCLLGAVGLRLFMVIWNKWISKEAKS